MREHMPSNLVDHLVKHYDSISYFTRNPLKSGSIVYGFQFMCDVDESLETQQSFCRGHFTHFDCGAPIGIVDFFQFNVFTKFFKQKWESWKNGGKKLIYFGGKCSTKHKKHFERVLKNWQELRRSPSFKQERRELQKQQLKEHPDNNVFKQLMWHKHALTLKDIAALGDLEIFYTIDSVGFDEYFELSKNGSKIFYNAFGETRFDDIDSHDSYLYCEFGQVLPGNGFNVTDRLLSSLNRHVVDISHLEVQIWAGPSDTLTETEFGRLLQDRIEIAGFDVDLDFGHRKKNKTRFGDMYRNQNPNVRCAWNAEAFRASLNMKKTSNDRRFLTEEIMCSYGFQAITCIPSENLRCRSHRLLKSHSDISTLIET